MNEDPQMKTHDRLPPHSLDAEWGLLACCLMSGGEDNLALLSERMAGRDDLFFDLRNRTVWSHMADMVHHGRPVDPFTLLQRLEVTGEIEEVGGRNWVLAELPEKSPTPLNFEHFWSECFEQWRLRQQLAVVSEAAQAIYDPEKPAAEIIESVESGILSAVDAHSDSTIKTAKEMMQGAVQELDGYVKGVGLKRGLTTGFDYFDKMTTGFYGKEMIVLAGRPGTGKTSLLLDFIDNIAIEQRVPTLFFSLEMTWDQLAHRFYCQRGRVDFQRLRTGYMEDADIKKITVAAGQIAESPLQVDDKSGMNILEIRSKARRLKRTHNIGLVAIDYMQLIGAPPSTNRFANRADQMSEISQHILAMAKELDVPVIVLAQLNREVEKSERPRAPRMSDLKESGQIEQDAHNITILYPPLPGSLTEAEKMMMDNEDWSRTRKRINARICKQRNGPTGDCALTFWKHCMHFDEHKPADTRPYITNAERWEDGN